MPQFQQVVDEARGNKNAKDPSPKSAHNFDSDAIQTWFLNRTLEIEKLSGLVDTALNFAELGIANGCKNLTHTVENLRTLYTLTYECGKQKNESETFYTLEYISTLSDLEKLCLMMSYAFDCESELYTQNLQDWLIPFVARRGTLHMRESLLREYLLNVSRDNLSPCLKLFKLLLKQFSSENAGGSRSATSSLKEINLVQTWVMPTN